MMPDLDDPAGTQDAGPSPELPTRRRTGATAVVIWALAGWTCADTVSADSWNHPTFGYVGRWRQYHRNSRRIGLGTATLIAPRWALTAKHVAQFKIDRPNGGSAVIRFGGGRVERQVARAYPAPGVDIALVELRRPVGNIAPVALLNGRFRRNEGVVVLTMIGSTGGVHHHRNRRGRGNSNGRGFRHSRDSNGRRPGRAGDSGGAWVLERFGNSPDVQFSVIHGGGAGPQVGPLQNWIRRKMADSGEEATWVRKSEVRNGTRSSLYRWTGSGRFGSWYDMGNWNPNGRAGAFGPLDPDPTTTVQLTWRGGPRGWHHAQPRLNRSWSLGHIDFRASRDHDFTIRSPRNWDDTTGEGRKTILLNGSQGTAVTARSDPDGAFSYHFDSGVRVLVNEDLDWNVQGDETVVVLGRLSGSGKIIKTGSGTLAFRQTASRTTNNGTNPLEIHDGTVELAKQPGSDSTIAADILILGANAKLRIGQDEQIADSVTVEVREGVFHLDGKLETIASLLVDDDGALDLESSSARLTVAGDAVLHGDLICHGGGALDVQGTLSLAAATRFVAPDSLLADTVYTIAGYGTLDMADKLGGDSIPATHVVDYGSGSNDEISLVPRSGFVRGNCNGDGRVDISDATCTLNWLFLGGSPPGCLAGTNTNGDGTVDIAHPTSPLTPLCLGGAAPPEPYLHCKTSDRETDVELGCAEGSCP